MAKELPKRSEVRVEDTWDLTDIYDGVESWEKDLTRSTELADKIAGYEGHIADSADKLYTVLKLYEELDATMDQAGDYAMRLYDQDTADSEHQSMRAKVLNLYSRLSERTAFVEPEILDIDDDRLASFYRAEEGLEFYRRQIDEFRRLKPHTLSGEMEKFMAATSEMARTASETFSVLNNADMTFPETTDEDGGLIRITHGRFIRLLESSNREVRKEAFVKHYEEYRKLINTYASLYNGQVKSLIFKANARHYSSTLEAAVNRNNVSPVVYHNLIDTVNKNFDKLHAYVSLRKKLLGVDELHMYDIYTPMIKGISRKVSFEEAKATCLKALAPLGEDYVALIKEGFDNRWIDVYENQGKRSGAYSAGSYKSHPYVLLNYSESLDDMFTLIHEMGHSIHSYLSNKNQPYIYANYKIFVAEVASTCNEVLLLEYLLKNTTDRQERAYLLNHYLDMFKGTLFRQTQFAEFELRTNEMCEAGESLNADRLNSLYKEINEKYYGPDMISDDEIAYEWARIPHFYYDYYVYQYATSFSAAVKIAHDILEQGAPVVEKYKKFLSSGCTEAPVELLRHVGVDLETCKPIQDALDVMDGVIRELNELA